MLQRLNIAGLPGYFGYQGHVPGVEGNGRANARLAASPVDWTWEDILKFIRQINVNNKSKLTSIVSQKQLTGRSLIDLDETELVTVADYDADLVPDMRLLWKSLRSRARHTISPVKLRSPTVWDVFSFPSGQSPVSDTSMANTPVSTRSAADATALSGSTSGQAGVGNATAAEAPEGDGNENPVGILQQGDPAQDGVEEATPGDTV